MINLNWFDTLKFDPYLRSKIKGSKTDFGLDGEEFAVVELDGTTNQVMQLWNKSNVNVPNRNTGERYRYPFEARTGPRFDKYPVTRWFGLIHWQRIPKNHPLYEDSENGKRARLVAVTGYGTGENGKYGLLGGTRVSADYQDEKMSTPLLNLREKNNPHKVNIAGYTDKGWKKIGSKQKKIKEHPDIPEEVINHFKEHYGEQWNILTKSWMQILKVDIDFDSDKNVDEGMMGYYAKPTPEGKKKYREILAEIQADAKRDLGMEMPEELIQEVMGLKEPVEHIKIFHKNVYAQLKRELGREPTDKEITNRMTSTITHEAVHAAHDKADPKFMERPEEQKEFIAYMLQYPDSVIDAIEDLRTHSAIYEFTPKDMMSEFLVEELGMAPELAQLMGFGNMAVKKNIRPLLMMVDWAYDMSKRRKRDAEILVRIELVNKKANPTAWKFPNNLEDAKRRYSELYKNDPKRRKNFEAWLKNVFE